jgi:hypothetical protein
VTLNATAYDSGQNALAGSSARAYVSNFLPQQKAPFYIDFGPSNIAGTDWGSTVSSVVFTAFNAYSTSDQEYKYLALGISFNDTLGGSYIVTGLLFNIGNQTANDIKVVGTYYNSVGTVVAVGFINVTESLPPDNYTTYTVSEFDATPNLVAQISNCSLLIQTTTLQNNNLPPTESPTKPLPDTYVYAIVAATAVAVVLIVVALLMFRKRKVASAPPPPPPPEENKASDSSIEV